MADEDYDRPPRRHRPPPPTDAAYQAAARHAGGSEDPSFFQTALQGVLNKHPVPQGDDYDESEVPEHHRPVRQEEADSAERVHREIYEQGGGAPQSHHSAEDVGQAAALHAFQLHKQQQQQRQQEDQEEGGGGGGGGGGGMQDFMGMAMGEATNLFNAGGGQGDKMAMVQSAAMMAMKIYMSQQQQSDGGGGGGLGGMLGGLMGGGGPSGMMGLLSKMM